MLKKTNKTEGRHAVGVVVALTACLVGFVGNAFGDSPLVAGVFQDALGPVPPASITIEEGTGIVAAGTGLLDPDPGQPGTISITVPGGSSVEQVLLYWSGQSGNPATVFPSTDTILVNTTSSIQGDLIGGISDVFASGTYRADITSNGFVVPGTNTLTVEGLNFPINDGAGVLVIFDDGSGGAAQVALRDGADYAYKNQPVPPAPMSFLTTVPQTFTFAGAPIDRSAMLSMFFSSVRGTASTGGFRPTSIEVSIPDEPDQFFDNLLDSNDGQEWDTLNLEIAIPPGATMLTVEALSEDRLGIGGNPASFYWHTAGLSPPQPLGCRFTGGLNDVFEGNSYRAGGQVGANTGKQPQPKGEWTHHQQKGPAGAFTFHGGTASAPEGTEIDAIRCSDPGGCIPSGNPPSPVKQLDFDGIGTFRNIGKQGNRVPDFVTDGATVTAEGNGNKAFDGTFHWFEVNIDDLGEPGNTNPKKNPGDADTELCPLIGFGEKGAEEDLLGECSCSDFYRITIYDGVDAADVDKNPDGSIDPSELNRTDVIYEVWGYIDGGNLQLHRPTGFDSN